MVKTTRSGKPALQVSKTNTQIIDEFLKYREALGKKESTLNADKTSLRILSNFIKDKDLKNVTKEDLIDFFTEYTNSSSYNLFGNKFKSFFRWIDTNSGIDIEKTECPKRMKWWEHKANKKIDSRTLKKYLITNEEYKEIMNHAEKDRYIMWPAIWETLWLSGAREDELASMKIKHVEFKDGTCTIYLPESKTKTREVYLPEYPYHLERWINNHPYKDDEEHPLWISNSTNFLGQRLATNSIATRFWEMKKQLNIKETLSVHCFRKTRATKIINTRDEKGNLIYTPKQIALFFGWSLQTVILRMAEYDLTSQDELKKLVFNGTSKVNDSYDIVKREKEVLENKHENEINLLKEIIGDMRQEITKMDDRYNRLIDKIQ